MKKNILKATFVAAFALIAGFNVYNAQNVGTVSDILLENVDALAYPVYENGGHAYDCNPTSGSCSKELGVSLPGSRA